MEKLMPSYLKGKVRSYFWCVAPIKEMVFDCGTLSPEKCFTLSCKVVTC